MQANLEADELKSVADSQAPISAAERIEKIMKGEEVPDDYNIANVG